MAALKLNPINLLKSHKILHACRYCYANTATGVYGLVDEVVTLKNNTAFLALHPTVDFPYEKSRPLPPASAPSSSLIKDTVSQNAMRAFGAKHPEVARKELMAATFTCKHRWFPRSRDKKRKPQPTDREYL